jgi:hypothetical protein
MVWPKALQGLGDLLQLAREDVRVWVEIDGQKYRHVDACPVDGVEDERAGVAVGSVQSAIIQKSFLTATRRLTESYP